MDALDALFGRHSVAPAFLGPPGPDAATLERILAAGAAAPDHGRLRPWRFIVVQGAARTRLGEVFAEAVSRREPGADPEAVAKERERPLRAPVVIALAARIDPEHPKIPAVEQILSTGAAAENILLAAHALGFGAKWLTGANAYDPHVAGALGLGPGERLAGFIHIGSIEGNPPAVPHAGAGERTTEWQGPAA